MQSPASRTHEGSASMTRFGTMMAFAVDANERWEVAEAID